MRYLYVIALILLTGYYTFPHENYDTGEYVYNGDDDDDDDRWNGDDDRWDNDDDDRGNSNKDDYFEVEVQTGLNFVVSRPEDFENTQTKVNAIKLNVRSKKEGCSIYAKVSSYTTPRGADQGNIPIEIQHRSDNSSKSYNMVTGPIQLSQRDRLLFNQKKNNKELNYYYDLRLMPLGYDYPEGQYNFTILYTLTKQ